jgi:hypothetical protein
MLSPVIRSVIVITFVCVSVTVASKFDLAEEINVRLQTNFGDFRSTFSITVILLFLTLWSSRYF